MYAVSEGKTLLTQRSRRFHDLDGPRPHAVILCEVHPADHPGRIQQKFCRPRDVLTIHACARMQQIVSANDLGLRVGEKGVRIARLATQIARHLGRVHTDRYRAYAQLLNFCQVLLDTP